MAQAVGQVTRAWLDSYTGKPGLFQCEVFREFVKAQPGTSWGLGWDTPSQPSSSGQWFSPGIVWAFRIYRHVYLD